ncbi:sialic acid-binding Ig-like lectin 14 [Misgurnus anguillicaudatus]|uniref:sialic acid-binding Ig-like lectin 14 n=1 Tax=Misgurnus anguillicaudatus TaxID=75329 RepID=UPI003CCF6C65
MKTKKQIILLICLLQGVWCEDWPISLPEKIEALSGSCVTINCTFTIDNKYNTYLTNTPVVGVWLKHGTEFPKNAVFYSNKQENQFKGNITGQLKDRNCTTIFHNVTSNHTGIYKFRIEGDGGLKYTYTQKSVSINVIDSPSKPTVQMFKDQMEVEVHEEVLEGSSVCLRCSAKTLCSSSPPTLTWSFTDRLHLNENSRLQLNQQNQTEIISDLNFTATHLQHGVTFICTITYKLQQRNTTAQRNITLRVQYAAKISLFSCNRTDVTVCLCEAHGNPSPKVEWHLSGRPVSNSTNTSISEEQLSSTDLRSFIFLHQSLTHTDTLQCVSINTQGTASHRIQQLHCSHETIDSSSGFSVFSVLIGAAIGASVVMILCVIQHLCKRNKNSRSSNTRREDTTGLILTDRENEEPVYANKEETSLSYPQSLHYSSIDFTNTQIESEEIRGVSSLTAVYADVRHYSGQEEAQSFVRNVEPMTNSNISTVEIADRKARDPEFDISTDTKQTQSKKTYPDLFTQPEEISELYAQVKYCHPKN